MHNKTPAFLTFNHLASQVEMSSQVFTRLSQKHRHMLQMSRLITPIFSEFDIDSVAVADYTQQQGRHVLVLTAPSQSAANHFNYLSDVFLKKIKMLELFARLDDLHFIYVPSPSLQQSSPQAAIPKGSLPKNPAVSTTIDKQSQAILSEASRSVRHNEKLSLALEKLAAHVREKGAG